MKFILIIVFVFFSIIGNAQIEKTDLLLIKQKDALPTSKLYIRSYSNLNKSKWQTYNPINLTFSGLMFFYQNVISSQVNAQCLFTPSCSEYAKGCIKKYGLIKGMFLAADRVQKCNRITALDLDFKKLNSQNRFPDSVDDYGCKHE
ncbi:MAG: membrane protein insertion efficiency factor YidD [Bacteroidia bacterium]